MIFENAPHSSESLPDKLMCTKTQVLANIPGASRFLYPGFNTLSSSTGRTDVPKFGVVKLLYQNCCWCIYHVLRTLGEGGDAP